ncbi:MAG: FHA domain-containing protein [Anaerolineales bacterium]
MTDVLNCENCGAECPPHAVYCWQCGHHLRASLLPAEFSEDSTLIVQKNQDSSLRMLHDRRAYFARNAKLNLYIVNYDKSLDVSVPMGGVILGRGSDKANNPDYIDLSAFDAKKMGVSREHARLTRMNVTLMIQDLGALNGTAINMQRLSPAKPTVVCHGDRILLGNLELMLTFES